MHPPFVPRPSSLGPWTIRRPLGLGRGHGLAEVLGETLEIVLGIDRRHAPGPCRGDRLAIGVVHEVAGREDTRQPGARRTPLDDDVALGVELDDDTGRRNQQIKRWREWFLKEKIMRWDESTGCLVLNPGWRDAQRYADIGALAEQLYEAARANEQRTKPH